MINLLPEPLRPGVPRAAQSWAMFGASVGSMLVGCVAACMVIIVIEWLRGGLSLDPATFVGRWLPFLSLAIEGSIFLCVVAGVSLLGLDLRRTLRLNAAPPLMYVYALVGMLALGLASDFVLLWLYRLAPWLSIGALESFKQMVSYSGTLSFLVVVFAMAVLPGICEEVLCRGFIQKGFERSYRPVWAIFWASVLFGLLHGDPLQGLGAVLIGFFLGFVAYRTNSLYPSVVAHFVNNTVAIYIVNQREGGGIEATLGSNPSLPFFLVGLLVGGLCILGLLYATRHHTAAWRLCTRDRRAGPRPVTGGLING